MCFLIFIIHLISSFLLPPILGNITYYSREASSVGQRPLYSTYDYILTYTTYDATKLGSCGFPVTYQRVNFPLNMTDDISAAPTFSPSASPFSFKTAGQSSGDSGPSLDWMTLLSGTRIQSVLFDLDSHITCSPMCLIITITVLQENYNHIMKISQL